MKKSAVALLVLAFLGIPDSEARSPGGRGEPPLPGLRSSPSAGQEGQPSSSAWLGKSYEGFFAGEWHQ